MKSFKEMRGKHQDDVHEVEKDEDETDEVDSKTKTKISKGFAERMSFGPNAEGLVFLDPKTLKPLKK